MKLEVNCDAAFNKVTNIAKISIIVRKDGTQYHQHLEEITAGSSESAELRAIIKALKYIDGFDFIENYEEVCVLNDNKNIIDGINIGKRTASLLITDFRNLNILLEKIREKIQINLKWIPRILNTEADNLCKGRDLIDRKL